MASGEVFHFHARLHRLDFSSVAEELANEFFMDLLDCSCGTGGMLRQLHHSFPDVHMSGLDADPQAIEEARRATKFPVDFRVGTLDALPFPDASFDVVLCRDGLRRCKEPVAFFKELHRVLRPNGRLILQDWSPVSGLGRMLALLSGNERFVPVSLGELQSLCDDSGMMLDLHENPKSHRLHFVAHRPR